MPDQHLGIPLETEACCIQAGMYLAMPDQHTVLLLIPFRASLGTSFSQGILDFPWKNVNPLGKWGS